jgi:hypothetical protein
MPSVSKSQQSLMGQAYGIKTGSLKPSDLNPKYRDQIVSLSKRMSGKELEKYASTKTKNLPQHVKEDVEEISIQVPLMSISGSEDFSPEGPMGIKPFLAPEVKKKKLGKKNLENLKDYRDWIANQGK